MMYLWFILINRFSIYKEVTVLEQTLPLEKLNPEPIVSLMIIDFHTHVFPESIRENRGGIYNLVKTLAGSEKILFGSDFPLIKQGRYFKEIKKTELPDEDIKGICGENAARLLNL